MTIKHIIPSRVKDLGEFSVRRILPSAKQHMVGPWIFFDHMGPAEFSAGNGVNVRPHPHINLATVTYLFDGETLHRDSLGSKQAIRPGDINLMVAGKGITHSEREREEVRNHDHTIHGLQLWHALPETEEETDPAFYHYPSGEIPSTDVNNIPIRLLMGSAYGISSPVKTFSETLYLEADIPAGGTLQLPLIEELAIYVVNGHIECDSQTVPAFHMAVCDDRSAPVITATEDTRLAIIGGGKMSKRYIEWNFVSSRKERIEQAKEDWKHQRFAKVPNDEEEFIPLPE